MDFAWKGRNRGRQRALAVAARAFGPVDFAWKCRHFWPRGARNRGGGRTLEGSGGSGARFWSRGFCVEMSSLLAARGAKPWQGRTLDALAVAAALLDPALLRGGVVTFGLEGREAVAWAYSKGLWR